MRELKNLLIVIALILLTLSTKVEAKYAKSLLVLDMRNAPDFPKKFRTSSDVLRKDDIDTRGLKNLHIVGSGQFSKLSLEKILQHLQVKYLTIIDLRQESHGFLNGNTISWYGYFNAANANKTSVQIEYDQEEHLNKLNEQNEVIVNKILEKTSAGIIEKTKLIEFAVHQVLTEAELAKKFNLGYHRVYVQDHYAPQSQEVDRFIQVVKESPKNNWIYIHCRGGSGRTTTFMMMYDMMHNAKLLSFEAILARQIALGGSDLSKLPEKNDHQYLSSLERLNFIKKFYHYAKENNDNFKTFWTDWLKQGL
jgi:protein-tyrosine phosphatase